MSKQLTATHEFRYVVTVTAPDEDSALRVMAERLGPDENYGFDYAIDWEEAS